MAPVQPSDGRPGDIWRITSASDHEMVVLAVNRWTITLNSAIDPSPNAAGYHLDGWADELWQPRADLSKVNVGDHIHLYVPRTDVYLLRVTIDERWPVLSTWFGYQTGRMPEPEGLQFHPSHDEKLRCELLYRPSASLAAGAGSADEIAAWQARSGVDITVFA